MAEPDTTPKKAATLAGAIGLVTAVIGLAGTALAVWDGNRDKDKDQPTADAPERLDNVPSTLDGYMSGPAYQNALQDHVLCYDWRPEDRTCQLIAMPSQRSERAVRMLDSQAVRLAHPAYEPGEMIIAADLREQGKGEPEAYILAEQNDYEITRQGICTTNAQREESAARVRIFAIDGDGASIPLTAPGLTAYQSALAERYRTEAVGEKQCWRYELESPQDNRVRQDYFLDGVLQPAQALVLTLVPFADDIILHIPAS